MSNRQATASGSLNRGREPDAMDHLYNGAGMKISSHAIAKNLIKCTLLCLATILATTYSAEVMAVQTESNIIRVIEHNMSIKSKGNTLSELLYIIQKNTRIEFSIQEHLLQDRIYMQFSYLPMDEALKKMLKGKNVSFIYGSQNALEKVVVFDKHNQQQKTDMPFSHFPGLLRQDDIEIFGPYPQESEMVEPMITEPAPEAQSLEEAMNITSPPQTAEVERAMRALGIPPASATNLPIRAN